MCAEIIQRHLWKIKKKSTHTHFSAQVIVAHSAGYKSKGCKKQQAGGHYNQITVFLFFGYIFYFLYQLHVIF